MGIGAGRLNPSYGRAAIGAGYSSVPRKIRAATLK
jgi:hypothetical protein